MALFAASRETRAFLTADKLHRGLVQTDMENVQGPEAKHHRISANLATRAAESQMHQSLIFFSENVSRYERQEPPLLFAVGPQL